MTAVTAGTLTGALVRLRPRSEEDLPLFVRWYSDPEVRHWLHISENPAPTLESESRRFQEAQGAAEIDWVIETLAGQPIGSVGLQGIDTVHGRAWLGVSIGEPDFWGRGYGTDAVRAVLRCAFTQLGLRRVQLITDEDNERGIRCYEKCGFVREGLLRAHRLRHRQPINMVQMAILAEDATWR